MKAVRLHGYADYEELRTPEPGADEVLVNVIAP
jgi:NADPH:quinone reductase-like Zn-dependent oxidoreductase